MTKSPFKGVKQMITRNGYTTQEQKLQYVSAALRHGDNRWAIKNHLRKHYDYSEESAWEIYEDFSGFDRDGNPKTVNEVATRDDQYNEKNYIVMHKSTEQTLTGVDARQFIKNADLLGIPRSHYRVFVEVKE
jgi:hypothetical protein